MNTNNAKEFGSIEEILAAFNDPYGRTISCAHRSYWRMYPENSVPAILAAIRKGCDVIELDVKVTADGVCVLTHDSTLARCTDAPEDIAYMKINQLRYDQIKDVHMRFATGGEASIVTDQHICTLEQAIKLCEGNIMINLDHVMPDRELTEATYNELLRLTKLGYHPFEYCMFKLSPYAPEEVIEWIRKKKEEDGVDIIYVPWGPAGAQKMMELGYTPPVYEYGFNIGDEEKLKCKEAGVGYFANTFEGCGQDDEKGWMRLIGMGANCIHTDEADWLPKVIRREFGEKYEIDEGVLASYSGVTGDMVLRTGIEKIADGVFKGIVKLRTMILPTDVKSIGAEAFAGCEALTDIFVPASVTEIGDDAFANCKAITIHVEAGSFAEKYAAENRLNYRVCEEYTSKYDFEFEENNLVLKKCYDDSEDIVLPDTLLGHEVYEVGRNALRGCTAKSVTFGKYVRMIEQHCLADCPNLRYVYFGELVNAIAVTAFEHFRRDLVFECKPGSYPFRYATILGITRSHPSIPKLLPISELEGNGTEGDPYVIRSVDDIRILTEYVNKDEYSFYANSCCRLVADIELDTEIANNFPMIGSKDHSFTGVFDGEGHTVKGVRFKREFGMASVFGSLRNAYIKNLNVVDIEADALCDVAGFAACAVNTIFENCHVDGVRVSGHTQVACNTAGFVASASDCTFTDCSAVNAVINAVRDGGGFAGVLAGCKLHRCYAEAAPFRVEINSSAGFVGNLYGACHITSCYATASVTGGNNIGGFSGYSHGRSYIENCFSIGIPESHNGKRTGGFAPARVGTVKNCYYNEAGTAGSGEGTPVSLEKLNSAEFLAAFCEDFVPGEYHPVIKK